MSSFSANENFLRDFHARFPGCTPQAMAEARNENTVSTYELLTRLVPQTQAPLTVLDLACGDGYLLERLAARRQQGLSLVGVDMSSGELAAAARRLGPGAAQLLEARAQAIPLPDHSVDFVLSHMALMLMDDADAVAREARRVLKPGGTFAAVVGAGWEMTPSDREFMRLIEEAFRDESIPPLPRIGDPRTRTPQGLRELFGGGEHEDHRHVLAGSPEVARDFYLLTYYAGPLSHGRRAQLGADLLAALNRLAGPQGKLELPILARLFKYRT